MKPYKCAPLSLKLHHPSFFISLIMSSFLLAALSYNAVALTVANTDDSRPGSLREAVANTDPGGTVDFNPSLANQMITLTTGEIIINKDLTIMGLGPNSITISGDNNSRIFNIQSANVEISDLKITDGLESCVGEDCEAEGGAMLVDGTSTLEITGCVFANNAASCGGTNCSGFGGAIQSSGSFKINESTFSGNMASCEGLNCGGFGGAIQSSGSFEISKSTFSDNMASCEGQECAGFGGAIQHSSSSNEITNTTICGNEAFCIGEGCASFGAAFQTPGSVEINNSTIADNSVSCSGVDCFLFGGSLQSPGEAITLINTIVSNNLVALPVDNCGGNITDGGNNLQFPGDSCGITIPTQDPMLGPLADHGGNTMTKDLLAGSPAIDAGMNFTCEDSDQRGVMRPADGDGDDIAVCDIGAFELEGAGGDGFAPGDANGDGEINILDVTAILNDILGVSAAPGNGDCNEDLAVNILDVTCVLNIILGV
jgi:hypothetical protein